MSRNWKDSSRIVLSEVLISMHHRSVLAGVCSFSACEDWIPIQVLAEMTRKVGTQGYTLSMKGK
jgi:hypothetical protein